MNSPDSTWAEHEIKPWTANAFQGQPMCLSKFRDGHDRGDPERGVNKSYKVPRGRLDHTVLRLDRNVLDTLLLAFMSILHRLLTITER
jgi:hypothetical protein